ncbi:MAG: RagB/SusD family nutrient uptake outer membrane protein, partial [Bacteroides sp.]
MKQFKYIAAALLLMGATTGCEDFLSVQSPDELTSDSFWRDKSDAEAGLASAYSKLESSTDTWGFAEIKWPVEAYREDIVDLGADALNYPNWVELSNFSYTNGNSQFTSYWMDNYRGINYCNQLLEKVPSIPAEKITDEDRAMIINEAHFLRAYYHMKLLLNWEQIVVRDVYITSIDQLDKALSTRPEAWDCIIADLEKGTALPAVRSSEATGRATRGAAYAFLGWAHLTRAYEETNNKDAELKAAVAALDKVQGYELIKDFGSMFNSSNKNSKEAVFELQMSMSDANGAWYKTQLHRWIGTAELWGWDEILPSSMLMNEFMKEGQIATTGRYDSRLYASI